MKTKHFLNFIDAFCNCSSFESIASDIVHFDTLPSTPLSQRSTPNHQSNARCLSGVEGSGL